MVPCAFAVVPFAKFQYKCPLQSKITVPLQEQSSWPEIPDVKGQWPQPELMFLSRPFFLINQTGAFNMCWTFYSRRNISHDGCFPNEVCEPACLSPSQSCDFDCSCAAGFRRVAPTPLTCVNIDDCSPNPCVNGATCVDGIQDYTCLCTVEFNKGKWLYMQIPLSF